MIDTQTIKSLSQRYQTTTDNVIQEYFQHLFLSHLYQQKDANGLLFKGGTALRIIWQSPRFSEDLDFTGIKITTSKIESILEKTLLAIEKVGISLSIGEAKKTSGGYLAIFHFEVAGYARAIQLEISLRSSTKLKGTTSLIASDFIIPYTLIHLDEKTLVQEKIHALLDRKKPRDYYDLYFILRKRLAFGEVFAKDKTLKPRILQSIQKQELNLKSELRRFLPVNQHGILKDFKAILKAEIERNLPN